jgi:hypothetical protein
MYQQLWGYKVEEKLYLGLREQKRLNTTALDYLKNIRPSILHNSETKLVKHDSTSLISVQ